MANSRRRTRILILLLLLVAALAVPIIVEEYTRATTSGEWFSNEPEVPDPRYFPSTWLTRSPERPLQPDRRFTSAVSDLRHLAAGAPCGTVAVEPQGEVWAIRCDATLVGTLPLTPRFADGMTLLTDWAASLQPSIPQPTPVSDAVYAQIEAFDSASLFGALETLSAQWERGERGMEVSGAAATALTYLALQVSDRFDLADPIRARALATLALAERAASGPGEHIRALLAWHMGYMAEARGLAAGLPEDSVFRAFVESDLATLERVATSEGSAPSARFLFAQQILWRVPERAEHAFALFDDTSHALAWVTLRHQYQEFVSERAMASFGLPYLTASLRAQRGESDASALLARTDLGVFSSSSLADLGSIWLAMLGVERTLETVEAELEAARPSAPNGVFARDLRERAFLAAYASDFWNTFVVLRHRLASQSGLDRFVAELGTTRWPETTQLAALLRSLSSGDKGGDILASAEGTIRQIGLLGPAAAAEVEALVRGRDPAAEDPTVRFVSALIDHLDTRPPGLETLASAVYWDIQDSAWGLELFAAANALRPTSESGIWFARRRRDAELAVRISEDPTLPGHLVEEARDLVDELSGHTGPRGGTPHASADDLRVLAEADRANAGLWRRWWRQLQGERRFDEALEVVRTWLAENPNEPGLARVVAATDEAHLLQQLGRLDEALPIALRAAESYQERAMRRAVRILVAAERMDEARAMAARIAERYSSVSAFGMVLELGWRVGDHDGTARALMSSGLTLADSDWRGGIAEVMAETFAMQPPDEVRRAVAALRRAGANDQSVMNLALGLSDRGLDGASFAILSEFPVRRWQDQLYSVLAYLRLARSEGPDVALDWLRARVPEQHIGPLSLYAYNYGAFEVLWEIVQPVEHVDYVWLLRAADWVGRHRSHPEREATLREHFEGDNDTLYFKIGRMLLGLEEPEEIDRLASNPRQTTEIAYYLGVLAESRGQQREADRWYRVVLATRRVQEGEYGWARSRLGSLWSQHRPPEEWSGDEESDPI